LILISEGKDYSNRPKQVSLYFCALNVASYCKDLHIFMSVAANWTYRHINWS